jgi:hypothetical protein
VVRLKRPAPLLPIETWIKFAKLAKGPLFRRVTGKGKNVGPDRLNDQEVARLVKKAALAAGVRGDLSEADREKLFGGHSLRAGSPPRRRSTSGMSRSSLDMQALR